MRAGDHAAAWAISDAALAAREKGLPIVNIAQPFKSSGMMLTCLKESGVTDPKADFRGKTLGVWFFGNEYPFLSWMAHLGVPTAGGADGVTVLKQGFNVDPLLQKQAAQIVGHLASLTDARDYVSYLAKLTPLVRVVLVSPVPDARGVAAKALGTLVERLGEVHFVDLVPSLLQVLRTDATGVDRHGAAQGLAEVLAGLGMERMERLLPTIIENTQDSTPYVREGHLALLIYLPATFGARFLPHLQRIVPPIVASMADDIESVREASLRAGRMLITNYTQRSVDLLLPQLEPRLFDTRHRVRLSALQLTADMLFRVSGISGKAEVENEADDETDEAAVAASSVQRTLVHALGAERRARILASIFILRQDPSMPVRQTAAHTWKALVHNTPRTAREVLPVMLDILLSGSLASDDAEQREHRG